MRPTIRALGLELLDISLTTDEQQDNVGESTTFPVGFALTTTPDELGLPDREVSA